MGAPARELDGVVGLARGVPRAEWDAAVGLDDADGAVDEDGVVRFYEGREALGAEVGPGGGDAVEGLDFVERALVVEGERRREGGKE